MRQGGCERRDGCFAVVWMTPRTIRVAQAEWAAKEIGGIAVDQRLLDVPRSFEARALNSVESEEWAGALTHSEEWLDDEPFSSRPATMGSYVAAVATAEFERSAWFARRGLVANPGDMRLLNNLVVALASAGNIEEARSRFAKIPRESSQGELTSTLKATEGLLRFREGDVDGGRRSYLEAMEELPHGSIRRALAALHLAREMLVAGAPEEGEALEMAERESGQSGRPEVRAMLRAVRRLHEGRDGREGRGSAVR